MDTMQVDVVDFCINDLLALFNYSMVRVERHQVRNVLQQCWKLEPAPNALSYSTYQISVLFNNTLNRFQRKTLPTKREYRLLTNLPDVKHPLFFFPLFVFRSTDSTKSTVESVSDITTIIPDGVTEVAIMYGGVASGTKIRIIRICGASPLPPLPIKNRNAE